MNQEEKALYNTVLARLQSSLTYVEKKTNKDL